MNKRVAGYKARNKGQAFENMLRRSAETNRWYPIQIYNGCEGFGKTIRMKAQQFDFVFLKQGCALFIDAKTIATNTFAKSKITPHQAKALLNCEEEFFSAGFIINFSELNDTRFYAANLLNTLAPGDSLKPADGLKLGDNQFVMLDLLYTAKR